MTELIEDGPFQGLRRNHYKVIYTDCPWTYSTWSDKGKDRSPKYPVESLDALKAMPVKELAAKDCVLFFWVIDTHLPMALDVITAWGFKFKTVGFYWEKTNRDNSPFTGMGFWTRANPEQCWYALDVESERPDHQCLLATTGSPKRQSKAVPRLIRAPRREHSRKPAEAYERIEALVDGPYLELFSREDRPGWDSWGYDASQFVAAPDLEAIRIRPPRRPHLDDDISELI